VTNLGPSEPHDLSGSRGAFALSSRLSTQKGGSGVSAELSECRARVTGAVERVLEERDDKTNYWPKMLVKAAKEGDFLSGKALTGMYFEGRGEGKIGRWGSLILPSVEDLSWRGLKGIENSTSQSRESGCLFRLSSFLRRLSE